MAVQSRHEKTGMGTKPGETKMQCQSSNSPTPRCENTPVFLWDYQDKTDGSLLRNFRSRPMCKPCADTEQARFWKYTLWNVGDAS